MRAATQGVGADHQAADYHVPNRTLGSEAAGGACGLAKGPAANVPASPTEDFRRFRLLLMDFAPR